ncbi:uncharacterized protein LOC123870678 [Maniola jurtina]|uniref:uncharacterized protein LOC123870678 n=1 Tax=Maniola jurtina TaxID=191418 RepID=UPI001E68F411|nr:uncharacterized protein LOC123870678 [Maniola jurtina]
MNPAASTSRAKVTKPIIHSQTRELARKVLENCEMERKNNFYQYPVNQALDRAVFYTGISKRTMSRIKSESRSIPPEEKLKSPKRRKKTGIKLCVDDFDRAVIHNTITEFYLQKKIVPTCNKLLVELRMRIPFPWGVRTLQRVLKKLGYRWRRRHNKRSVLIEKPDIVFKRYHYLKKIREFRENNRNIFYVDERWVDNNLTFKKCWQMSGTKGIVKDTSSGNALIVVNAAGRDGFLPGASLIFNPGTTTGDFHGQMNGENFEKWVVEKLLPSLPERSVVVMDNAPYHSVQLNKPPTKSSPKYAMINWLLDKNVYFDRTMRKPDLYNLIEQLPKPVEILYNIDTIIKGHGHEIVRLPPYMCDLNPVEFAWGDIKRFVREHELKSDFSSTQLEELTVNAISTVSEEYWQNFEKHVQVLENDYWEKDMLMENEMEDFNTGGGETSDEDSLSVCSDISISSLEFVDCD